MPAPLIYRVKNKESATSNKTIYLKEFLEAIVRGRHQQHPNEEKSTPPTPIVIIVRFVVVWHKKSFLA